jgi:hypothetical protein
MMPLDKETIIIPIVFSIILFLPHLLLLWNYRNLRDKVNIKINKFSKRIIVESNVNSTICSIPFGEVEKIEFYATHPFLEKRMFWSSWDTFNYSIIYWSDKEFIITSFIIKDIRDLGFGDKIIENKTLYPLCLKQN